MTFVPPPLAPDSQIADSGVRRARSKKKGAALVALFAGLAVHHKRRRNR
jgi:hypothetical protein